MSSIDPISTTSTSTITSADYAHSLQAMIELVYVRTANEVLSASLTSLESALSTTQGVVRTLTGLQNLHNELSISAKGKFPYDVYASGANQTDYNAAASAFFGSPINPSFSASKGSAAQLFLSTMAIYVQQINDQIAALSATTPRLANGGVDPNSLYGTLLTVRKDLSASRVNTINGCMAWVLDKYNLLTSTASSQAGKIQQNLTSAITAAQSLNDTQKETVQRYLYLFQEYYQSASAMLQAMNQLIQKIAGGISR